MIRSIDYSALLYPVSKEQLAAFKADSRAGRKGDLNAVNLIVALTAVVVVGGIIVLCGFGITGVALTSMFENPSPGGIIAVIFPLGFLAAFAAILVVAFATQFGVRSWETRYRLTNFAKANGMIFSARDSNPAYPGAIFTIGDSRHATNHLRSASDRFLDIGNYSYSTGSGKSRSTRTWGFMALQLDRKLPNMVLDSKANNGLFGGTNLPAFFAKNQVLSLEGDFNQYFTLYCPKQYERDALYVFTPDLMALLIDEASPFDVEIVDAWMFVYSSTAFKSTDPAVYQRLFRIVDTVGAKALAQTDRYVDEKVGDFAVNYVAPQGQRLKRGVSLGLIVFVAVFALLWLSPFLGGLFAAFTP